MYKIAIISFFHAESSLCLAKYLAKRGIHVDYYFVANLLHDRRLTEGFIYQNARRTLGNHLLSEKEVPEMYDYMEALPVRLFLSRIIHHNKYPWLNKLLMRYNMWRVKRQHYDAINIVGQSSWIKEAHEVLKKENLIHTFHELGNHDGELVPLEIVKTAIMDHSKIILHSQATYNRFKTIDSSNNGHVEIIPFGRFETCRLYEDLTVSYDIDHNKVNILLYGYLAEYKGLDVLSRALSLLADIKCKFNVIIAGSGDNKSLSELVKYDNITIYNHFLSNAEMMYLIKNSSVILLPYKSASQTGIISTCSLYGKPVIATKVGAFPEMVKDGGNGILIDPNDEQALATAIKKVVLNKGVIDKLGEEMSNWGKDDSYSWLSIANQTIALYNS